ncbi:MAG: trehalose-phosphatase [Bdellovibrionales bacterium RIFOXYC1_FULL_54_43]|nr:MAG: trehalose-phosphatase [Bdellovibrionales bacterium RIFOXYC1_FULL_54_43]OFZ83282.1 MAG: trehalose-phosphatase [Bdellovibrionales bacterium RIFOXYD1_FULL_55_31]
MKYLFSRANVRVLESLSLSEALYAFDFDGTLAPIVSEPGRARMSEETESLFMRLSAAVPTAVISGRSLADLRRRIPSGPKYLVGNHGLEGIPGISSVRELENICNTWKCILSPFLDDFRDTGIVLEDKGVSLALHYRASTAKKLARERILDALQTVNHGAKIIPGKLVFNIVPNCGPHKGIALSNLIAHSRAKFGFFVGDDHTDEDVFTTDDRRFVTVRVGMKKDSLAAYYLRRQSQINRLLRHLLRLHGSAR